MPFFLLIFFIHFLQAEVFIESYLTKKGYQAQTDFSFKNEKIKISLQLYSPVVEINKEIYFLEQFPYIGKNGITLTKKDFDQFKEWLSFYENYHKQFKEWNSLKKRNPTNQQKLLKTHQAKKHLKKNVIFLDAGHGGKDPGCMAYGYREKDLTLMVATNMVNEMKKNKFFDNINVVLTRTNDTYIDLEGRCNIANNYLKKDQNGIFVSIHFNIWATSKPRGIEVYYLQNNEKIFNARVYSHAKDVQFSHNNHVHFEKLDSLKNIFSQMDIIQYQKESQYLSQTILNNIKNKLPYYPTKRGSKPSTFFVLKGSLMPSVLVEVGFLSNKEDLKVIEDKNKRNEIIKRIVESLQYYFLFFEQTDGFKKVFWQDVK